MKLTDRHPLSYRILLVLAGVVEPLERDTLRDLMGDTMDFDPTLDAMVNRGIVDEPDLGYYNLPTPD